MTKSIFETIVVDPKFAEPAIEYAHSDEYKAKRKIQEKEWAKLPMAKEPDEAFLKALGEHYGLKSKAVF